jgi:hypothetical protein
MNLCAGMVNQFHDHVFRDALAMTPCNERYTSAVKTDPGHANLAEELAPDYSNGFSSQSGQSPSASCMSKQSIRPGTSLAVEKMC